VVLGLMVGPDSSRGLGGPHCLGFERVALRPQLRDLWLPSGTQPSRSRAGRPGQRGSVTGNPRIQPGSEPLLACRHSIPHCEHRVRASDRARACLVRHGCQRSAEHSPLFAEPLRHRGHIYRPRPDRQSASLGLDPRGGGGDRGWGWTATVLRSRALHPRSGSRRRPFQSAAEVAALAQSAASTAVRARVPSGRCRIRSLRKTVSGGGCRLDDGVRYAAAHGEPSGPARGTTHSAEHTPNPPVFPVFRESA
jgi:hypothetical protein